jgi:tetratricopeptide (TPR) repeat protein
VETTKKAISIGQPAPVERNLNTGETLNLIKPNNIVQSIAVIPEPNIITTRIERNIIYLYDLKISDYNSLYFGNTVSNGSLFKTHTPVYKENPGSVLTELESEEKVITADRILKEGLQYYSKKKFNAAQLDFKILLELNPGDVNAQFYSALAFYNLKQTDKAVSLFEKVMANSNTSFYPEAEWLCALIAVKKGDKEEARSLLLKIVSEKGFYSKRAAEKLKSL